MGLILTQRSHGESLLSSMVASSVQYRLGFPAGHRPIPRLIPTPGEDIAKDAL